MKYVEKRSQEIILRKRFPQRASQKLKTVVTHCLDPQDKTFSQSLLQAQIHTTTQNSFIPTECIFHCDYYFLTLGHWCILVNILLHLPTYSVTLIDIVSYLPHHFFFVLHIYLCFLSHLLKTPHHQQILDNLCSFSSTYCFLLHLRSSRSALELFLGMLLGVSWLEMKN